MRFHFFRGENVDSAVGEKMSVQVVKFMAERTRAEILPGHGDLLAVQVQGAYRHFFRTMRDPPDVRHGQTALQIFLLALAFDDLRVDQAVQLVVHLDQHHASENTDLRCRESHSVRFIKGFFHILCKLPDARGDLRYGTAGFA